MATYSSRKSVEKGVAEGGIAGSLAILLGVAMGAIRANNPDLPWGTEVDGAVVGATTGLLAGVAKWWRNRKKHR
jgi:hypothetical protein